MIKIQQQCLTNELKEKISTGFTEYAFEKTGIDGNNEPICFIAHRKHEFAGAVIVKIFWGQLHIKTLFVKKEFRGLKLGNQLMQKAFAFGKEHKCNFAFVETMSFQALDFYNKLGFEVELTRNGYANDTAYHYLKKNL